MLNEKQNKMKDTSIELLEKIKVGIKVCRWSVYNQRYNIRDIYHKKEYEDLIDEVEDIIDSAKESL